MSRLPSLFLAAFCALAPLTSIAMMAGAPPDSPAARVDPATSGSGVVAVKVGGSAYSGVLLANRYVLTAAHVAAGSVATPGNVQIVFNLSSGPVTIVASRIDVFPSYSFPHDDLALVQLSANAPAVATRHAVQDAVITNGTAFRLVGHGGSGNGNTGVSVGSSENVRRAGENVVDMLTTSIDASGKTSAFYLYDFDGSSGNGPMGGPTLGNARETMVAPGDSGSPAFMAAGGDEVVMGINTFASPLNSGTGVTYTFGQGGGGMRLSDPRFLSWLRTTSAQEVRFASELAQSGDVPIPLAASVGMAGCLLLMLRARRRTRV